MNLTVDIGNSRIKYGLFEGDELVEVQVLEGFEQLRKVVQTHLGCPVVVCSVRQGQAEIIEKIPELEKALFLTHQTKVPIGVNYKTPETLGMDRLAAALGAFELFPENSCLIIDAGTCITYDALINKIYEGGMISPGIHLRYRAMNDYTANLPLLNEKHATEMLGKSTQESMVSGVINGIRGEMEHVISQLLLKKPDLKVIMTGGDAEIFESKIKSDIFVALEIVLLGLNRVLKCNA